jgi:hypothetical protein
VVETWKLSTDPQFIEKVHDVSSGSVIAHHYRRHRQQEFLRFLKLIDADQLLANCCGMGSPLTPRQG